ncbi:MAG: hypothetical protein AB8B60_13425 [Sulfitobacter sp.]
MAENKREAQIDLLCACATLAANGRWHAPHIHPNGVWDLVEAGLITPQKKLTLAGRMTLFLLGKADDPLNASQDQHITILRRD